MKLSGPPPRPEEGRPLKPSGESHLVVLGLNYHSCPITIREKFVIPDSCVGHALRALRAMPHVKEAALLSTCNRTEVYAVVSDVNAGLTELESFFMSTRNIDDHFGLRPNFKLLREDVALHLFRVASGLDSLVLGEGQIMSQVKAAHRRALEAGTCGTYLDQLFKLALNCGKRVRTETSLGRRAVSVSSAAVELGRDLLGCLRHRNILIVGAGRMAQICAKHLLAEPGTGQLLMINRTPSRLEQFAINDLPNIERLNTGLSFEDRYQLAAACDMVIVSTSASTHLFKADELKKHQAGKPLVIIDISVPRNVDPSIAELPDVRLYHADDLAGIVNRNRAEREALVCEAEGIVFSTLEALHCWERSLVVAPTITDLRKKIEAIRTEYLIKNESSDDFEHLSRALINQILHHPTVQLKSTSDYQVLRQQAEALRSLFNLDPLSTTCGSGRPRAAGADLRSEVESTARFTRTVSSSTACDTSIPANDSADLPKLYLDSTSTQAVHNADAPTPQPAAGSVTGRDGSPACRATTASLDSATAQDSALAKHETAGAASKRCGRPVLD